MVVDRVDIDILRVRVRIRVNARVHVRVTVQIADCRLQLRAEGTVKVLTFELRIGIQMKTNQDS